MIDIYGLTKEQEKAVKNIIDAFKVSNASKEKDNIIKEKNNNDTLDQINFNVCNFDGVYGIFTQDQISNQLLKTLPNGVNHYDIRHDGMSIPISIEKKVSIYKLGTLITCDKVYFDSKDYKKIHHYRMNINRITYTQYIKNMRYAILNSSYSKELNKAMTSKIMNDKIIMINPDYDLVFGTSKLTDTLPILVDKDNPFIPVYSCLWSKGWSTLSNPNTMKKYNKILFGKCNDNEIKLIKEAAIDSQVIMRIEDIKDAEAYNIEVIPSITRCSTPEFEIASFCNFSECIKRNAYPYPIIKKWDLQTVRLNDGSIYVPDYWNFKS